MTTWDAGRDDAQIENLSELCRGGRRYPGRLDNRLWRLCRRRHADQSLRGAVEAGREGVDLRLERDARRFDDAVGCTDDGIADRQRSGEKGHLLLHGADPRVAKARL